MGEQGWYSGALPSDVTKVQFWAAAISEWILLLALVLHCGFFSG